MNLATITNYALGAILAAVTVYLFVMWRLKKVIVIPWPITPKRELTTAEQNERLYANIATCMAFGSCSIIEIMKNEPATVKAFDPIEWLAMLVIYGVFIYGQRLNAIKAYRSDPNVRNRNAEATNPEIPPQNPPPPSAP